MFAMREKTKNISNNSSDDFDENSCCEENLNKILIVILLFLLAIGCGITLAVILFKQNQREKALMTKKNSWSAKLEECAPILKIAGPIIKMIIKIAMSLILL